MLFLCSFLVVVFLVLLLVRFLCVFVFLWRGELGVLFSVGLCGFGAWGGGVVVLWVFLGGWWGGRSLCYCSFGNSLQLYIFLYLVIFFFVWSYFYLIMLTVWNICESCLKCPDIFIIIQKCV